VRSRYPVVAGGVCCTHPGRIGALPRGLAGSAEAAHRLGVKKCFQSRSPARTAVCRARSRRGRECRCVSHLSLSDGAAPGLHRRRSVVGRCGPRRAEAALRQSEQKLREARNEPGQKVAERTRRWLLGRAVCPRYGGERGRIWDWVVATEHLRLAAPAGDIRFPPDTVFANRDDSSHAFPVHPEDRPQWQDALAAHSPADGAIRRGSCVFFAATRRAGST